MGDIPAQHFFFGQELKFGAPHALHGQGQLTPKQLAGLKIQTLVAGTRYPQQGPSLLVFQATLQTHVLTRGAQSITAFFLDANFLPHQDLRRDTQKHIPGARKSKLLFHRPGADQDSSPTSTGAGGTYREQVTPGPKVFGDQAIPPTTAACVIRQTSDDGGTQSTRGRKQALGGHVIQARLGHVENQGMRLLAIEIKKTQFGRLYARQGPDGRIIALQGRRLGLGLGPGQA